MYIDDLLVITKGSLDDHLNKLEAVFIRLRDAGLKVNAAKSFFCTAETEYLGYILTRGGVKPQKKKIQAILALNLPNNVKELRQFLGIGGPAQVFPPILFFLRGRPIFSKCQKTPKNRQTPNKERPFFRHDEIPPPIVAILRLISSSAGQSIIKLATVSARTI